MSCSDLIQQNSIPKGFAGRYEIWMTAVQGMGDLLAGLLSDGSEGRTIRMAGVFNGASLLHFAFFSLDQAHVQQHEP